MNPRLKGFDINEATLYTTENIKPGMAVMVGEEYTAVIPVANARFAGICTAIDGNFVSIAFSGVLRVPFSGSDIVVGYNPLSPDGNGYLKFNLSSSAEYLVLDVDEDNGYITIMLK